MSCKHSILQAMIKSLQNRKDSENATIKTVKDFFPISSTYLQNEREKTVHIQSWMKKEYDRSWKRKSMNNCMKQVANWHLEDAAC